MSTKVFLKNDNEIMLPITRGELILDSSGQLAFHSGQFLAKEDRHGLMSYEDKINIKNIIEKTNDLDTDALNSAINSIKNEYLKSVEVDNNKLTITNQSNNKINFYNTIYTFESGTDGSFTVKENGGNSQTITIGTLTDEKVGQKNVTDNKEYRILLSNSDNDNDETAPSNKSEKLLFNPSTGILTAKSFKGDKFDGKVNWNYIDNKPETFTPETHNHPTNEIFISNDYKISENSESINSNDTLTKALGKLEYKANLGKDAWDWISLTMSDTDDNNTNIDRLKEIFDVLKDIKETDVITSIVGNYLPLGGGTITGTLAINRNASAIHYNNASGTSWGWMGFSNANTPTVWMSDGSTSYSLYHSGNLTSLKNPNVIKFKNTNNETKSYDGSSELDLTSGINYATLAATVKCVAGTSNVDRPIVVTNTTNELYHAEKVTINYTTGNIKAPSFQGDSFIGKLIGNADSATKATQDSDGNVINTTYLKLTGGSLSSNAYITWTDRGAWGNTSATYPYSYGGLQWKGTSDWIKVYGKEEASDKLNLYIEFGDDAGHDIKIDDNGSIYTVYHSGNLTKVSQLTNDSGFVTGGPYLPLLGGILSGDLTFGAGSTDKYLTFSSSTTSKDATHSYRFGYIGSGTEEDKLFVLQGSQKTTNTWSNIFSITAESLKFKFEVPINTSQINLIGNQAAAMGDKYINLYNSTTNAARIGTNQDNALGLYSLGIIYICPKMSSTFDTSSNGLVISDTTFTYNGYSVLHGGNYLTLLNNVMTFDNGNSNYLGANFVNKEFSKKASSTYIEFWDSRDDSESGWFNSKWGKVIAVNGFEGALTGMLNIYNTFKFGLSGLLYFQLYNLPGTAVDKNLTPLDGWWHIIRMNHGNDGYMTELASPFNGNARQLHWRTIYAKTNSGWYSILDQRGGNLTGSIICTSEDYSVIPIIRNIKFTQTTGWARKILAMQVDGVEQFSLGAYGYYNYPLDSENPNKADYLYLGFDDYSGNSLRVYPDGITFGNNTIWHSGNCNFLSSTNKNLTPAGSEITNVKIGELIGYQTINKSTWVYANNGYIETGWGKMELAGSSILSFGTSGAYTQLFISAPSSSRGEGLINEMMFYNNHGSTYSPGWTRVITNRNYTKIIGNPFKVNAQSYNTNTDGSVSTGDIYLEMWRGDLASWKLINTGGTFKFLCNYTDTKGNYYDALTIGYNTGNIHTKGGIQINATSSYNDEKTLPDHAKLIIGNVTDGGTYGLYFSRNSILHMTNNKAVGNPLLINPLGGLVKIGSGGLESSGNILPASTNTCALGNTSIIWGNVYTSQINLKSGYNRKIILNNTDADDKWQLISFQQNGTEYGRLGTTGDDNLIWNYNIVWHTGNDGTGSGLDADLLDGTHKSGLLTNLTSSPTTNLSITVGGTTKSVTDLYSTYLSNAYSSRPTTLSPGITGDGTMILFKNTSSCTDSNKPGDGHVLHFNWDNAGGWDSQILITNGGTLYARGMETAKTWGSWKTILDSSNFESFVSNKYLPLTGGTMEGSIITPKDDNQGILPHTNNYGQIGSSSKKFYRMYATTFNGNLNGSYIELSADKPYVDFHYNSSSTDYTSRIIQKDNVALSVEGLPLRNSSAYTFQAITATSDSPTLQSPTFIADCSSVKFYTFLTIDILMISGFTGVYGGDINLLLNNLIVGAAYIIRLRVRLYNASKNYWNSSASKTLKIYSDKGSADYFTCNIPASQFDSNKCITMWFKGWIVPTSTGLASLATF